jgi:hypothetical protein
VNDASTFVWRGMERQWSPGRVSFWAVRPPRKPRRPAVWCSADAHARLRAYAEERGVTIAQALRRALRGRL